MSSVSMNCVSVFLQVQVRNACDECLELVGEGGKLNHTNYSHDGFGAVPFESIGIFYT